MTPRARHPGSDLAALQKVSEKSSPEIVTTNVATKRFLRQHEEPLQVRHLHRLLQAQACHHSSSKGKHQEGRGRGQRRPRGAGPTRSTQRPHSLRRGGGGNLARVLGRALCSASCWAPQVQTAGASADLERCEGSDDSTASVSAETECRTQDRGGDRGRGLSLPQCVHTRDQTSQAHGGDGLDSWRRLC